MIKSFADKRTAAIFAGYAVKGLPHQLQRRARAKLQALDAGQSGWTTSVSRRATASKP